MMRAYCWLVAASLTACTPYLPSPIEQQNNIATIQQAHPDQEGFRQFVQQQAPAVTWPITQWDLHTLTLAALYFHPSLKVAKSDYAVALAGITTAGLKPKVGLNGNLDKSNQANGDLSPWAYGLQVDVPIITASKRQIAIEVAQHQADVARIMISEMAWSLRQQLSVDLIARAEIQSQIRAITQLNNTQAELLAAYQKRLDAGLAGKADLLQIRLQYDQSQWQLQQFNVQLKQIEQKIAHDAGLTEHGLQLQQLTTLNISQLLKTRLENSTDYRQPQTIQHQALTNRMDIQRGLAQYARAEAQLKLEMAKRYPDISLSPGILYEYGDKIWSLGIGGMLNLLNRSSDLWAQAEQVRQNEAARFYALQHQVIQQSEQVFLKYHESAALLTTLTQEYLRQPERLRQVERQWRQGLIDKPEWLQANIQFYSAQQRLVTQQANVLRTLLEIENLMQKPLLLSDHMPSVASSNHLPPTK